MLLYLIADGMLVVACAMLHVTMMRRYHSRPDLRFQATLLALAAAFVVCGVVFLFDAWQVWSGHAPGGPWPRLTAGVVALIAAIVVASPETQKYYMSMTPPEDVQNLRDEMNRILTRWQERDDDVRCAT